MKDGETAVSELVAEGLVILLTSEPTDLSTISTYNILAEIRKVPGHIAALSLDPLKVRDLITHLKNFSERKATASEKKLYEFLTHTVA